MDYATLPWLILGGVVVLLGAGYVVIRLIVKIIRFLTR